MSRIWICHITEVLRVYALQKCHTCSWVMYYIVNAPGHMGWLRLVGSLKLWISIAQEPYKRDHILQKIPIILRSLLIVATPYVYMSHVSHMNVSYYRSSSSICTSKMSRIGMSHVLHRERVRSYVYMSHVSHMNVSYCRGASIKCTSRAKVWSHATHMNESGDTHEWVVL